MAKKLTKKQLENHLQQGWGFYDVLSGLFYDYFPDA